MCLLILAGKVKLFHLDHFTAHTRRIKYNLMYCYYIKVYFGFFHPSGRHVIRINVTNDSVWSDDGCQTTQFENGSVLCSCNHLTHFAILLSPGVEVREE